LAWPTDCDEQRKTPFIFAETPKGWSEKISAGERDSRGEINNRGRIKKGRPEKGGFFCVERTAREKKGRPKGVGGEGRR
jgi:hypothetical protein